LPGRQVEMKAMVESLLAEQQREAAYVNELTLSY
jgi:hypothetical protein